MAESNFEKTEQPTPRRRAEAREEGNVARSSDLTAALSLLAAMLMLYYFGIKLLAGMRLVTEAMLSSAMADNPTRANDVGPMLAYAGRVTVESLAPVALGLMAVTLLATVGQVGFLITGKPLMPDFSRLSPLRGLKNMTDVRAGVRLIMALLKVGLIAAMAAWFIYGDLPRILSLGRLDVMPMFGESCGLIFSLAMKLAVVLLVLAVLDYAFQWWKREQDLRMSRQELKEEMKRMEGDPLMKQRRTRVARQLALQRIGQAVPKADVVVTNPTHFAVALQYDGETMKAPKVVAKGADFMAMRIRQLAVRHGVPMVERKELARALYRTVEIGQEVPPQFYNAVAEILAYVYRLSERKTA
jgi:flagellar biosynthesis protein FlhB